ncbi:MAG: sugar phosphate isomerase/epimerase, partial [Gemmatimonadetes bacterium]|nr:sugar phosphate isomerase/epimerase [Gemmatimonadota bacterium]
MARNKTANYVLSAEAQPELELAALLAAVQKDGLGGVELFRHRTSSSVVRDDLSVRGIRDALAASQVKLAAYEIRPLTGRKADSDERNLAYNLRQLEWDTHLGRALGIRTISVRGGTTSGPEQAQEARADLLEGLGQLVERIPDVTFAVGPAVDSVLQTAADFDELLSGIDGVGVILDVPPLRAA